MKLNELLPEFITSGIDGKTIFEVETMDQADGIMFLCPKCFEKNKGIVGTHRVVCWSPKVSQNINPSPGRWEMLGNGFDDLTLKAGSSSVLLTGGCRAHFFITDGNIKLV